MKPMLTVIILTKDEEQHIARSIASVKFIADRIVVVDSGSTDGTVEIAKSHGAQVLHHPFVTQAKQFNWAIDQIAADTEWVLRLDADEIVSDDLRDQISESLPKLGTEISGIVVGRRMSFLGRPIRYGGLFPIRVLRIFRHGEGRCEDRWMDEHIKVTNQVFSLSGEILDDNLNSLTWWTTKHNTYASREVVDLLNLEYGFMPYEALAKLGGRQTGIKRWLKEKVYARMPVGIRAFAYFFYRYVLRFGFLDGKEGLTFHVLQGFWYRFLVDAKLEEVRRHMKATGEDAPTAILRILDIDVTA